MKKLCCLIGIVCVSLLVISAAIAEDLGQPDAKEGVKVTVKYDPLGPNNLIVAFVKFINNNGYRVHVDWNPIITCEGSNSKEGYGEPFDMNEGGSYQVTMWRSAVCQDRKLKDLSVEMDVKRITGD